MRRGTLRTDLSMLRQGLSLEANFGWHSLEELARVGLELEEGIYRAGSLRRTAEGIRFHLGNPPLRIGAFHTIRIFWDGAPWPADRAWVATEGRPTPRPLSSVSAADPVELGVGESSEFALALPAEGSVGPHRVRVEWVSVAVPPVVWLEFRDEPRPPREGEGVEGP
ncbi:MAG TPA: hypothetical protein VMH90_02315 [Thermoplasmata archaeon]|nr:hypothetical protein [Thermoplasmata archaeon]